jgi:hypothetical protein
MDRTYQNGGVLLPGLDMGAAFLPLGFVRSLRIAARRPFPRG